MALWCHREPKAYVYDYLHVQGQKERQEDKGLLTTEILSFYSGKKPPFLYLSLNVSFPIPAPPSRLDLIACTEYKDTCPLFKQSLVNGYLIDNHQHLSLGWPGRSTHLDFKWSQPGIRKIKVPFTGLPGEVEYGRWLLSNPYTSVSDHRIFKRGTVVWLKLV